MSIKKLDDGKYLVDIRPTGRNGKRIRKLFDKKAEAIAFERYTMATHKDKPWADKPVDARSLAALIDLWWTYHGQHMKWGTRDLSRLRRVDLALGEISAAQIDQTVIATYRTHRLMEGLKPGTVNRNVLCLGGMFTALIKAGLYHGKNPVQAVGKLKVTPAAMTYLTRDEIARLLALLDGENRKIVVFCLSTGARWSEAATLRVEHIMNCRALFAETKNGLSRVVPISAALEDMLLHERGSGFLFPGAQYFGIRRAIKEVKPTLKGQALHVLRHTYATHFMINGGSIITLQRILGHANIQQTMTYAHFAPDYLSDAITRNPLRGEITASPTHQQNQREVTCDTDKCV